MDIVERLRGRADFMWIVDDRQMLHDAADMIERLRALVQELADEVEAEIKSRYDGLNEYATIKRRRDRDMDLVNRARAALNILANPPPPQSASAADSR